jgi:hypothetical protein
VRDSKRGQAIIIKLFREKNSLRILILVPEYYSREATKSSLKSLPQERERKEEGGD